MKPFIRTRQTHISGPSSHTQHRKRDARSSLRGLLAGCLSLLWSTFPASAPQEAAAPEPQTSSEASTPVRVGSRIRFGLVWADPKARTVTFPARVNQTNGLLEYAVVTDYGKTHESLLVTDAKPMDVQSALLLLRARPVGTQGVASTTVSIPREARIHPSIAWSTPSKPKTIPLHQLMALTTGGPSGSITGQLAAGPWVFTGSQITPEGFGAHFEGSLISLIRDPIAILNNPGPDADEDENHIPNSDSVPPYGTEVSVILALEPPLSAAPATPTHAPKN